MASILSFVRPCDEVIVIEPFYDLYIPVIELAGGKPVIVPMTAPTPQAPTYRVDWQRMRDAITPETRMLILNFPHNPTRSEEHTSELQSLMRISYAVFCLQQKTY